MSVPMVFLFGRDLLLRRVLGGLGVISLTLGVFPLLISTTGFVFVTVGDLCALEVDLDVVLDGNLDAG